MSMKYKSSAKLIAKEREERQRKNSENYLNVLQLTGWCNWKFVRHN